MLSWAAATLPSSAQWEGVAVGNGRFVALDASGGTAYSDDGGETWTAGGAIPTAVGWVDITFGNGLFVAIRSFGSLAATSPDGITWTMRTLLAGEWYAVTFGNGMFVAIADNSTAAASSPDGITWTARTLPSSGRYPDVTYGGGAFVVVRGTSTNVALRSTDGITWSAVTLPSTGWWRSVAYGAGQFVAVQNTTASATSPDGVTWTAGTMAAVPGQGTMAFGADLFVQISAFSDDYQESADGDAWTAANMPASATWVDVAYDADTGFVAVAGGGSSVAAFALHSVAPPSELSNVLIKDTDVLANTELVLIPGTPEVPARAGYYTNELQTVCGWVYNTPGHFEWVRDPDTGDMVEVWIADPGYPVSVGTWVCSQKRVPVYHPPTPYQPATPPSYYPRTTYSTGYNLGWNSGARSISIFTANANVQFQAGESNVGAIVGMNIDDGAPVSYNGNTINFGFYLARGVYRLIQNGVITGAVTGTYTNATVFRIERLADAITYKVDGVTVATVASGAPTGAGWLEAALYSGQDYIFNPSIEQVSAPDSTDVTGTMAGSFKPMMGLMTEGEHAEIAGALPALTGGMTAGALVPSFAVMGGPITLFSANIFGLTGEIGSMSGSFARMSGLMADHAYGAMAGSFKPMQGIMLGVEGNTRASMVSSGVSTPWMKAKTLLIVTMTSTGQLVSAMTAHITEHADMMSVAEMATTMTFRTIEQALMFSYMLTRSLVLVPGSDEGTETWVVEMDGGAFGSSQYSGFNFNSYATIGGRAYGADRTGLYLLEGDTDAGTKIDASIDYGRMDFGTITKKTISECFVGVASSGALYLKVIVEGQPYVYRCDWHDKELQQQRFKLGKGMKSNYITPILYNADGADFELDTVQFVPADLSRKL